MADDAAMLAGDRGGNIGQQMVHRLDRPSGDDGERAAEPVTQGDEGRGQVLRHDHRGRRGSQVDQGAVQVEEQGGGVGQLDHARHPERRTS